MLNPYRMTQTQMDCFLKIQPNIRKSLLPMLEHMDDEWKPLFTALEAEIVDASEKENILLFFSEIYKETVYMGADVLDPATRVLFHLLEEVPEFGRMNEIAPHLLSVLAEQQMVSSLLHSKNMEVFVRKHKKEIRTFITEKETDGKRLSRKMDCLFSVLGESRELGLEMARAVDFTHRQHGGECSYKERAYRLALLLPSTQGILSLDRQCCEFALKEDRLEDAVGVLKEKRLWDVELNGRPFAELFTERCKVLPDKEDNVGTIFELIKSNFPLENTMREMLSAVTKSKAPGKFTKTFIEYCMWVEEDFLSSVFSDRMVFGDIDTDTKTRTLVDALSTS
ncbi:MAG: uncharacterized protein A8A55_3025, partial [Amphiamblys sp. WSBS2006]